MDFKAIISNCGEETVYNGLSGEVERRLSSAPVEWKRSLRRPSKDVVLQASFVKFNSEQLNSNIHVESFDNLTKKPLLHLFWTSCIDNDVYKSSIKNQVANWQKHLNNNQNIDWLVVHVMYQENAKTGKSKIQLPRSSVFDKLKSDFGQDRCVQLWEPDKETLFTKSSESWEILLQQLRSSLLASFGRHLDKFEEKIRTMREKYADPKWPFFKYFLVHEELAFIYQSITLNEDALIQYDEVDALLSQFIINCSGKEFPVWLEKLSQSPKSWDGVMLSAKVASQYKAVIESNEATLLDLRNYVFLRQCKLLIKMKRKWEIPPRLLEFLFAVIHELKLLKVDVPNYVVACWIVMTCLQVIPVLEKDENSDHTCLATVVQAYNLMRQKIHLLGQVTGVYFNREQTEEEKNILKHLQTGIGVYTQTKNTSVKVIEEALGDSKSFENLFVEVTKACINKFSDIGRLHSEMFVGLDLAKFYLQRGHYLSAEPLLERSWSIYKSQKWETLYTDVLIPLADCQLKHKLYDRYLNSVCLLSSASCLPYETRDFYSKEVIRLMEDESLNLPVTEGDTIFKITSIKVALVKMKGHIGDTVKVNVVVDNYLTVPVTCRIIVLDAKHHDLNNPDSFSDVSLSARKSLFENKDYGMNSISPKEKEPPKEDTVKEALTPSNLLKRIKSHRRTWSKNKNTLEGSETKTDEKSTNEIENNKNDVDGASMSSTKRVLFTENTNKNTVKEGVIDIAKTEDDKLIATETSTDKREEECDDKVNDQLPKKKSSLLEMAETLEENGQDEIKNEDISLDLSALEENDASTPKRVEEDEPNFDITFTSEKNLQLSPGKNKIPLTALITQEGKYQMKSINCLVGHLQFDKNLNKISRKLISFFMVTEPPRITWTTNYLVDYSLTGSKQRIHVTIMNGPGFIKEDSILHIFSNTGLKFYMLDASSIEVFPLERDGKAREGAISIKTDSDTNNAYMTLPQCKPYERVNVYFDVMAPMHQEIGEKSTFQHEINFVCHWLEELAVTGQTLDVIFYEPFQLKYEAIINSSIVLLKVTICGVNPVHLYFSNPKIKLLKNEKDLVPVTGNKTTRIYNNEEAIYLWRLQPEELGDLCSSRNLECLFSINFKTKDDEETSPEYFEKNISIPVSKCFFAVDITMNTDPKPTKSHPCTAHVRVKKLCKEFSSESKILLKLDPREHYWRLNSKESELELNFGDDVTELSRDIELVCDASGMLSVPLLTMCIVDDVQKNTETGITEVVTSFKTGEIDYLSSGKVVFIDDTRTETDV